MSKFWPYRCHPCRMAGKLALAVVIYDGTTLCDEHYEQLKAEIMALEALWMLSEDEETDG